MSLVHFLRGSRATSEFQTAVAEFLRSQRSCERIRFNPDAPPVKVERTLTMLLKSAPELEIDRVEIRGSSGCEYFRGELVAFTTQGRQTFRFHWDCKWKAEQQGWKDFFGFPDQTRAAREFGFDCFRGWSSVEMEPVVAAM